MKKFIKYIMAVIILFSITAAILLLGMTDHTSAPKKPIQQQTNADINRSFSGESLNFYAGESIGNITINKGIIPFSPPNVRIYEGIFHQGDLVEKRFQSTKDITNPIPAAQAPAVAKKILEQYGGLPQDAQLQYSSVDYANLIDRQTGDIIAKVPQETFVSWYRTIDGIDLVGSSDIIQVELGENGELNRIYKCWRTYTPLGNVSIIPATKAIDKLALGEILNPIPVQESDVSIYHIHLSYYIKGLDEPEVTLEPIWVFYGNATGNYIPFYVYARQFANFTATPTYGRTPLTVSFTDTSDASPIRWNWDFGDGTKSTEKNPVHVYQTPGKYNISMRAWNDLGSDTSTKYDYISVLTTGDT